MKNKLVVIINSLKVPKIKIILLYEMKFLVPNYSCLQNPWPGGYCLQIPVLCPQLNLLNTPPRNKIPGYATVFVKGTWYIMYCPLWDYSSPCYVPSTAKWPWFSTSSSPPITELNFSILLVLELSNIQLKSLILHLCTTAHYLAPNDSFTRSGPELQLSPLYDHTSVRLSALCPAVSIWSI